MNNNQPRILIFGRRLPWPLNNGWNLRVFYLCKEMRQRGYTIHLAVLEAEDNLLPTLKEKGIFDEIHLISTIETKKSVKRHFRLNNKNMHKLTDPPAFRHIVDQLNHISLKYDLSVGVATLLYYSEYIKSATFKYRIVDDYDCQTLTLERQRRVTPFSGVKQWVSDWLRYIRTKNQEKALATEFDLVTTISPIDQKRLAELATYHDRQCIVIPNGVSPDFLKAGNKANPTTNQNSVVFWGHLPFQPNYSAIKFFYHQIFVPYLDKKDVKWFIIGAGADDWINSLPKNHQNIHVMGFVEDLIGEVSNIDLVINPMIAGSGLKNKVLEAFAIKKPVVSTQIGVEAIEATKGLHYLEANTPKEFALSILELLENPEKKQKIALAAHKLVLEKYSWEGVGLQWCQAIEALQSNST